MQLCLGSVYAWSVFKKPMMDAHGWGETQTQAAFMISSFVFALAAAFGGYLIDKKGPRFVGMAGGLLFGSGIVIAGLANSLANPLLLYLGYGLIGGLGGGLGYITPITTLIRWFPDKKGFATGIAVMGYGFGAFIMGRIAPKIIIDLGVAPTFYFWGIASLLLVTGAALIFTNPPKDWHPSATSSHSSILHTSSITFGQAIRTPQWWILWTILFLNISAGLGFISQLSPIAQDVMVSSIARTLTKSQLNAIAIASGTLLAVCALFNGFGRIFWAWVSDGIGRKKVFVLMFSLAATGYVVLPHIESVLFFGVISCILLACYGGGLSSMPAFTADEFGPAHIGEIYGMLLTASSVAGIFGPFLFARVKETTDSFAIALYTDSGLLVLGLILAATYASRRKNSCR